MEIMGRQSSMEIDDSLYSRQRYVLGDEAMKRMHKAAVLILGMGGLGVEIAKNLILGGVRRVCLWDNQQCGWCDLASNFYITEEDVKNGIARLDACLDKLRELNPGVTVEGFKSDFSPDSVSCIARQFNCVIATEIPLSLRIRINNELRRFDRPVPFISADAFGILAGVFCDFGDDFLVHDPRTEEGRELLASNITQAENGVVTCMEGYLHNLEIEDLVQFKDVGGMTELNGQTFAVTKIVSPLIFCIGDTTGFSAHEHGGIVQQALKPKRMSFESLEHSISHPVLVDCDLARPNAAKECHLAWKTILKFLEKNGRLPLPHNKRGDVVELLDSANALSSEMSFSGIDQLFLEMVFSAVPGQLNPLLATMGGIVAQEAMKALTGKFTPLQQWLYTDAREVYGADCGNWGVQSDRYDGVRICIGDQALEELKQLRVFMIGCGAIGCEMLKNMALIGVGSGSRGQIQVTDDDHIEKSNLNRQFLFRPEHIGQSKSVVAAKQVQRINPEIHVLPHQLRVLPATQKIPFSDEFFHNQNVVINALDNVQARVYMDQRCVTNSKPLLDSGTLGTKGHVQVVIPFLSESYGSQRDPSENAGDSIPYCTLKQFPALMEHCIEWAREKFQSSFSAKPDAFNNFWQLHGPSAGQLLQTLQHKTHIEGVPLVYKLISRRPKDFQDVVQLARLKFEKYFSFKAQQLLSMFPLDHTVENGVKFWQSPKRPPVPVIYDAENPIHLAFVRAACILYSKVYGHSISPLNMTLENLKNLSAKAKLPSFVPKGKEIDPKDGTPVRSAPIYSAEEAHQLREFLEVSLEKGDCKADDTMVMHPEVFEKDDDTNAHIDYIYAAANLRAEMYRIEKTSRIHVKRIAGRIVPAIATTTACVSGLATLELIKLAQDLPKMKPETKHLLTSTSLERYNNTFLNLAIPVVYFSEPAPAPRISLPGGVSVTLWDQWTINGNSRFTMQNFLDAVKKKYSLNVSSILLGSKMVYMPFMPEHRKRLPQPFHNHLDPLPTNEDYVDLSVDMEADEMGDGMMDDVGDEVNWPPVRYYFR